MAFLIQRRKTQRLPCARRHLGVLPATGADRVVLPRRCPAWRSVWSLLVLLGLLTTPAASGQQVSREYQLKAVFLFNFARFTHWPTNAFATTNEPIVIGVLGNDPFGPLLDDTVRGEIVEGRRLVVERYRRIEDVKHCHILFLALSESRRFEQILEQLNGRPVLTVADLESPASRRVMIRFVQENNKLRLRVNLDATSESRLTISSKLLRASEVVSSGRAP